jgi:hypothetical protein
MKLSYKRRPNDFKRKILERNILDKKDMFDKEYVWLSMIRKSELGIRYYNLNNNHNNHWSSNKISTLSLREKISATAKKNAQDPLYREKYLKGIEKRDNRSSDPVVREKRRQSMLKAMEVKFPKEKRREVSKKRSQEHRNKLSEASKRRWSNPNARDTQADINRKVHTGNQYRLGHINTEEHIEKIRAANKGKKRTAEQKQRISEAKKGKTMTPAMRAQHSIRIKEMWMKRRAGIIPMPNYNKEKI